MPNIESKLNPRSDDFKANAAAMQAIVDDLRDKVAKIALGGGAAASAKHVARGKLLPRDRVQMLLDPGTPFLELSQMAAYGMYQDANGADAAPSAGIITGIGRVSGQECVIVCNDATDKGGTYYPITVKKHLRAQMLLDRDRIIGAALVGGVVTDDDAFLAGDAADAGDDAGRRRGVGAVGVLVHAVGGHLRQFEEGRAGIEQHLHAVARQQLAARDVLGRCSRAAAEGDL